MQAVRPEAGMCHDETLIFFILRLMVRLRALGTAPAADLMEYGRALESLCLFSSLPVRYQLGNRQGDSGGFN
jgi:hypothetical protein